MNSSTNIQNFLTKIVNTDKGLLFGFVLSNYEITLAFFCKTVKTLSAPVTGSRSLYISKMVVIPTYDFMV